ncbi:MULTISPECIES: beta-galactosidase small subunit-related protein [Niastella]|uniref:beta-galactosidase n=1 Tax=Niastella soli TaxID=2821487 RepID=A0ABS3Z148_9BACT|nr:hypothetical protein [Niastella soli]MBO9203896.1 hypothetical protein [Niastella soli]
MNRKDFIKNTGLTMAAMALPTGALFTNIFSLNGDRKFNWVQVPHQQSFDFYKNKYKDDSWKIFKVPSNRELNGYGLPIYVNHPYEFTGRSKMSARLKPPFEPIAIKQKASKEYLVNIRYTLKNAEPFLEADYEVACEKSNITTRSVHGQWSAGPGRLQATETTGNFTISGKGFALSFDNVKGVINSYVLNGIQLLAQGSQPAIWRAPADNDIGATFKLLDRTYQVNHKSARTT